MPKMVVSIDGVVVKEVQLLKERTTLGRRPYNDVVIDNLAISGEHAVLHMAGDTVEIEDLASTNGTYVNGQSTKRQVLNHGDVIEVGKYQIRFVSDGVGEGADKNLVFTPGMEPPQPLSSRPAPLAPSPSASPLNGAIHVLSGAAAGRELPLVKVVTTIGKPGATVASITRRAHAFVLAHVDGQQQPLLNGQPLGPEPVALTDRDRIELAGTTMEFVQH